MKRIVGGLILVGLLLGSTAAAGPASLDGRIRAAAQRGFHPAPGPDGRLGPVTVTGAHVESMDLPALLIGEPDPGELARLGVRVNTRAGRVWSASVPARMLSRLAKVEGLVSVRLATPLSLYLDTSLPAVRADQVRTRTGDDWTGFTGDGVIVGLVDSGLDVTHHDFRRPDGSTRVLYLWGQADSTGVAPSEFPDSYGSEWTAQDIDAGLTVTPDEVGHGTHVAGIMAGDGSATGNGKANYRFAGVAPRADLIVVATDLRNDHVLDAVNYVFQKAAALGMPAVVNLSLGSQFGPHDGTMPLDLGLDALVGPGQLVVAAVGNEALDRIHGEVHATPGGTAVAEAAVSYSTPPDQDFNFFDIDAYYVRGDSFEVTVITPSGRRFGPYGNGDVQPDTLTGEGTLFLAHFDPGEGITDVIEVFIEISDTDPINGPGQAVAPVAGDWRIEFTDLNGAPRGGEVDLWNALAFPMRVEWKTGTYDPGEEIATPASASRVISVGSFNTRRCWQSTVVDPEHPDGEHCTSLPEGITRPGLITYFSSQGPTRDDREEPDLVAPGFIVVSALSTAIPPGLAQGFGLPRTEDEDGVHMVRAGTSMSAPHVTGTLALALQARPDLTPEQARQELRATAVQDDDTGAVWNPRAGSGKLDTKAFLDRVPLESAVLGLDIIPGGVRLTWEGEAAQVAAFRLQIALPGEGFREEHVFSGAGPHSWVHEGAGPGTRYRLWMVRRAGGDPALWAEAEVGTAKAWGPAHPNPFRTATEIPVPPGFPGREAQVLDVSGRVVRRLRLPVEGGRIRWDGADERGRPVPAGIYWVRPARGTSDSGVRVVRLP